MLKRLQHLLIHRFIRLREIFPSLRMSDDNIVDAGVRKHSRRNLARIRAAFLVIHILRANFDIRSLCRFHSRNNVNCRNAEHHVRFLIRYQRSQFFYQCNRFARRLVHFPVSGDNFLSCHIVVLLFFYMLSNVILNGFITVYSRTCFSASNCTGQHTGYRKARFIFPAHKTISSPLLMHFRLFLLCLPQIIRDKGIEIQSLIYRLQPPRPEALFLPGIQATRRRP